MPVVLLATPDAGQASPPDPAVAASIAHSAVITVSPGSWELGKVTCPTGTFPTGGGVGHPSAATTVDIGSSYPSGRSWIALVNNFGAADESFTVQAVCMPKAKGYHVVSAPSSAGAEATTQAYAQCPAGEAVTGGGVQSAINLYLGLNTSIWASNVANRQNAWAVSMSNASPSSGAFTVYAICSDAGAYVSEGPAVKLVPGAHKTLNVTCPEGVPLGGGGYTSVQNGAGMVMTYSFPTATGWTSDYYDGSNYAVSTTVGVLCS